MLVPTGTAHQTQHASIERKWHRLMVFSHSCQNMKYMLFVRTTFRHSDKDLQRKGCSCALIFNEYNIPNNAACNCLPFASTCVSLRFFGQVRVAHLFSYLCCVVLCVCVCFCFCFVQCFFQCLCVVYSRLSLWFSLYFIHRYLHPQIFKENTNF